MAKVGSLCAALDTRRSAKRIGKRAIKKLNFLENGCNEPINENIKPLKAERNENKYSKIKNSVSIYIFVLVRIFPVKKIKSMPVVINRLGISTEKN